jgi:hypothetical protein
LAALATTLGIELADVDPHAVRAHLRSRNALVSLEDVKPAEVAA